MLLGCLSASFLEQFLLLLPSCSWFSLLVGNFMAHHVDRCAPFSHLIPCCLPSWMTLGWLLPTPVDIAPCLLNWTLSWVCAQLSYILPHPRESFKFQVGSLYISSILLWQITQHPNISYPLISPLFVFKFSYHIISPSQFCESASSIVVSLYWCMLRGTVRHDYWRLSAPGY